MKLNDILLINETIKKIIDDNNITNFNIKFKLLTIVKSIEKYVLSFEQLKNEKIKQYGTEDEDGNIFIKQNSENIELFKNDINELLQTECDYSSTPLEYNEIFNCGIPSEYLVNLIPLVKGCD